MGRAVVDSDGSPAVLQASHGYTRPSWHGQHLDAAANMILAFPPNKAGMPIPSQHQYAVAVPLHLVAGLALPAPSMNAAPRPARQQQQQQQQQQRNAQSCGGASSRTRPLEDHFRLMHIEDENAWPALASSERSRCNSPRDTVSLSPTSSESEETVTRSRSFHRTNGFGSGGSSSGACWNGWGERFGQDPRGKVRRDGGSEYGSSGASSVYSGCDGAASGCCGGAVEFRGGGNGSAFCTRVAGSGESTGRGSSLPRPRAYSEHRPPSGGQHRWEDGGGGDAPQALQYPQQLLLQQRQQHQHREDHRRGRAPHDFYHGGDGASDAHQHAPRQRSDCGPRGRSPAATGAAAAAGGVGGRGASPSGVWRHRQTASHGSGGGGNGGIPMYSALGSPVIGPPPAAAAAAAAHGRQQPYGRFSPQYAPVPAPGQLEFERYRLLLSLAAAAAAQDAQRGSFFVFARPPALTAASAVPRAGGDAAADDADNREEVMATIRSLAEINDEFCSGGGGGGGDDDDERERKRRRMRVTLDLGLGMAEELCPPMPVSASAAVTAGPAPAPAPAGKAAAAAAMSAAASSSAKAAAATAAAKAGQQQQDDGLKAALERIYADGDAALQRHAEGAARAAAAAAAAATEAWLRGRSDKERAAYLQRQSHA